MVRHGDKLRPLYLPSCQGTQGRGTFSPRGTRGILTPPCLPPTPGPLFSSPGAWPRAWLDSVQWLRLLKPQNLSSATRKHLQSFPSIPQLMVLGSVFLERTQRASLSFSVSSLSEKRAPCRYTPPRLSSPLIHVSAPRTCRVLSLWVDRLFS